MTLERISPGAPPVAIGRGLVASSFQYYLTGDESLRLEAISLTGTFDLATVDVGLRLWRASDRAIVYERESHVCNPAAFSQVDYPLTEGALLSLRLSTPTASAIYGMLFVRASLIVGSGTAAQVIGTLAQGYISPQNDRAWPGSPNETMLGFPGFIANPIAIQTAGPVITLTVPAQKRYRVMSGFFSYVANGAGVNRLLLVKAIDTIGGQCWIGANGVNLAPGGTGFFGFAAGQSPSGITFSNISMLPWPADLDLTAGMALQIVALNANVADVFSNVSIVVKQWMDA